MTRKLLDNLAKPVEADPNSLFRFGTYAGMTVDQVPTEYLLWALRNLDKRFFHLLNAIQTELLIRTKKGESK